MDAYHDIAKRAAERAREGADDGRGKLAADAAEMAAQATERICEADDHIQRAIALLAVRGSLEAVLDLLDEAGQRTSTARHLACRSAELSARVNAA